MEKVKIKVRFNAAKEVFEKVSRSACILYLPFPEDDDSVKVMKSYLSKNFATSVQEIDYMGKDSFDNYLFILN